MSDAPDSDQPKKKPAPKLMGVGVSIGIGVGAARWAARVRRRAPSGPRTSRPSHSRCRESNPAPSPYQPGFQCFGPGLSLQGSEEETGSGVFTPLSECSVATGDLRLSPAVWPHDA